MLAQKTCPECGATLPVGAPYDLCPRCLLRGETLPPIQQDEVELPQKEKATVAIPLAVSEKPGDIIDRYKLLEKIGEGGFGVVYLAEQKEPVKRRVALKIIKLGMDTREVVARFEAERQALAILDH